MNQLHIYPTSRALRTVSAAQKEQDGFLPALMRMDEFEQRAILLDDKVQIDPLQRILLLREAASFQAFESLNLNLELVRFFTKSDALFKFFEELAAEQISFDILVQADAYAEFETHLGILEQLFENYRRLLDAKGFTDKALIPHTYRINEGFLQAYENIEIHLEGYLSHFELELIEKIAKRTQLIIHYTTSPFNVKMQERFEALGITLENDAIVSFDLSDKKIVSTRPNDAKINANVFSVEERQEQIAVAFVQIEKMVRSGILPEEIVLILPDESFKEHFTLFDTQNNLNFAMGYDYANGRIYKSLEALYRYWQNFESEHRQLLERYGFDLEIVEKLSPAKHCNIEAFFRAIDGLGLLECPLLQGEKKEKMNERVYEKYLHFLKIFAKEELRLKEWLFFWLKALSKITIDDVRGGMVTVMGVLETRGVSFEGVVIVDFNEGVVPAASSKDQFLNSSVRAFANLPTKNDREALQKQYYKRLLEQAKEVAILYSSSDNKLPSKFLYELGLKGAVPTPVLSTLLYDQTSQCVEEKDPQVEHFNAQDITWSASRLKTYLECKRKYYYRYIQKIEAKKEEELNEGAFLHLLLDHLYREKASYENADEMQKKLDILLDQLLPFDDSKTAYKKLLWKEKLKGFVTSQIEHFKSDWSVVEREVEVHGEIGGLRFKGRIDRIDQNTTDTLILDYKSGSTAEANKTKNLENLADFQMSIYHHMLTKKYQNITLAFVKILEGGRIEEITALEEKNEILAQHIIDLKQTNSFTAEKCEDLQKCKYCEFTLMCERGEYL
ncbi:PD-(D/E)XK nuclease family protein [Sulfurovum sp. XTW-4]|uniref:PD-(D/E)XK nuclease family protein n=1 Tax=Sulfurovum xiamenensis TaxID=3019066 RepID=A0ABT7QT99_9BACT|nr:PD-(D/E)XK nuclease family protein [Sulfurovum xiamenensis]MDM5263794.1 PD-(D/E)XK nuclease family protein [Sulfurovum xiamenensis]